MTLPFFTEQGQGDTAVFLLHGVGGGHAAWAHTLPALAQAGYRAIAWDAPGYGASPANGPLSMALFADALLHLIRRVGAPRNIVVGHSMGGMIAQEAMARAPGPHGASLIQGLVLFATSPAFGKPGGDWQQQFLKDRFAPLDAGLGMADMAPGLVRAMLSPQASPQVHAEAVALMSGVPQATYRAALSAIVSFNQLENLPRIAVPTLCLGCELDTTAPASVLQKMAGKIPHAQFKCLNGVGHLGNMEQPDAFNAALLEFLKSGA